MSAGTRDTSEESGRRLDAIKASGVKLYMIACGKEDPLAYESSKVLNDLTKKHGIDSKFRESEGGHTWSNWRLYLSELAPMLFQ
jgi:enterochelin esterase-like enzyme